MVKAITIYDNEEYLRQISKNVDIKNDKDLKNDLKILEEFCKSNSVMAMAVVQLGIPKRLIYLKNTNLDVINKIQNNTISQNEIHYNEARILINPIITKQEGLTKYWEACASCLNNCGLVLRPYKIYIEYYDIFEKKHKEIFEGFESTVLSHEMDHLDGILHIDIAEKILLLEAEERKKLRQKEDYEILSKTGDYEKLKQKTLKPRN